jgi:hypothetical protein
VSRLEIKSWGRCGRQFLGFLPIWLALASSSNVVIAQTNAAGPISPCKASLLSAMEDTQEADEVDGGLGHHAITIAIQNRSSSSCVLNGVPALTLSYFPENRTFPVRVCSNCGEDYLFSSQPVKDVVLEPWRSAYVVLGYNINDGAGTCTEADPKFGPTTSYSTMALDLRLPNQSEPLRIVFPLWRSCGAIGVTPFLEKPPVDGLLPDDRANPQK